MNQGEKYYKRWSVRQNVLIFCYQLGHIRTGQRKLKSYISNVKAEIKRYNRLVEQIKEKSKERKALLAEQKELCSEEKGIDRPYCRADRAFGGTAFRKNSCASALTVCR